MENKYSALIFNPGNDNPIGETSAKSISELRNKAIRAANYYNGKGGRIIVQEKKTGRIWNFNS